jgi:hypothetical protein
VPFWPFCSTLGDDGIEHQRGVADHRMRHRVLLVDVGSVVGGMHDGLARRHAGSERRLGQAGTHGKDEIGLGHEIGERLAARPGRGAKRQRMVLGDRALALDWW